MIKKNISNLVFLAIGVFVGVYSARTFLYSRDRLAAAIADGLLSTGAVTGPDAYIHIEKIESVVKEALKDPSRQTWTVPSYRAPAHMRSSFPVETNEIEEPNKGDPPDSSPATGSEPGNR